VILDELAAIDLGPRSVALAWLGQASVALRFAAATVLVDPFLSPHPERLVAPPFAGADARGVDAVLVTHDHLDHLDDEALPAIANASPRAALVVHEELVDRVAALGIDRSRITGLAADGRTQLGALTVDAVAAAHGDTPDDAYRLGAFLGYVVSAGGARVYHSGDTVPHDGLVPRVRAVGVDLALLPINGRDAGREAQGLVGNLDAREAAELARDIDADAVVPLHWDMFAANLGDPGAFVAAAETTVVVPRHFRPFVYTASSASSR
jgi:L-ascorbate metabolism protein UlaG (beta-lactamase superfamily)